MAECRSNIVSLHRRKLSFGVALAHARLRLSRLEIVAHAGRVTTRNAAEFGDDVFSPTTYAVLSGLPLGAGGGRAGFRGGGPLA